MKLLIVFFSLLITACQAQNNAETNHIFETEDRKFGVKSSKGKILIEPIYVRITPFYKHFKQILPPPNRREEIIPELLDYYQVYNHDGEMAILDTDGKIVFDFCECMGFQIDEHTKTLVAKFNNKGQRTKLYNLKGKALFEETFQEIGYINDSDLIALIKEDGADDEFYLYNPFTKKRIGPYDHFNVYNKDFDPTMGIKTIKFERLIEPIGISVRQNDTWGFVSMQGEVMHPMEYDSFRYLTEQMQKTYIQKSERPENVQFMFYARLKEQRSQLIFFDTKLNKYSFTRLENGGSKLDLMK